MKTRQFIISNLLFLLIAILLLSFSGLKAQNEPQLDDQSQYVFVTNTQDNSISKIDAKTNQVVDTYSTTESPYEAIIDPTNRYLIYASFVGNYIEIRDMGFTLVATIPVDEGPQGLALSTDGSFLYVLNTISNELTIISTITYMIIDTYDLPDEVISEHIVIKRFDPDEKEVQINDIVNNKIYVIDLYDGDIIKEKHLHNPPRDIVIPASSNTGVQSNEISYIPIAIDNTVVVLDIDNDTILATIPVGNDPRRIIASPDGSYVYVTNYLDNNVSVIETATNTVTETINLSGQGAQGIDITPDGQYLYVTNFLTNTVSVIETATNTETNVIAVGTAPYDIAITPVMTTGIEEPEEYESFVLNQNFPNPFHQKTTITYSLPLNSNVNLSVFNISGQKVAELINQKQKAGDYQVRFETNPERGKIFFYTLKTGSFFQTKKMIMVNQ